MALIPCYEVNFKSNSTHKTGLWDKVCTPLIYNKIFSYLVDVGSPTVYDNNSLKFKAF